MIVCMENQQMLHAGAVPRGAPVHAGIPNVVAGPFGLPALHRLRARYVRDWTMLSSVHFGAAERYRNKHRAGMVTLAIVALYGAIITVLGLAMKQSIDAYVLACSNTSRWLRLG